MAHPVVQCEKADFNIATGVSNSLEDFVRLTFAEVRLDWRDHTVLSDSLRRPTDISDGGADASKAERLLAWKKKAHVKDVIAMMMKAELEGPERRRAAEAVSHNS